MTVSCETIKYFPKKLQQIWTLLTKEIICEQNARLLKFGYSEKATKFEKIFHLKFDTTQ